MLTARQPISPYIIETVAMLERSLNYAHTGNGRVLMRKLMDPAWISLGCIADGLPCISEILISHPSFFQKSINVVMNKWPVIGVGRQPRTASKRVQELVYGAKHYEVRSTCSLFLLLYLGHAFGICKRFILCFLSSITVVRN